MYQNFFNMTAQPFTKVPDFFFYADTSNEKTFGNLAVGMARGEGFIVVAGAPGTGKSSLATLLAGQYQSELFHVVHLVMKKNGDQDLLRLIAGKLGINAEGHNNADLFRDIGIHLARISAHGGRGIFIVDDAHFLSPKSLNTLNVLAGHKVGKKPLVQVLLFGRRELLYTLNREEFSNLRKSIVARIFLHPYTVEETQAYILHRLQHAEWKNDPRLTLEAMQQVYTYTGGVPGRINRICDHLLKSAYHDQNHVIDGAYTEAIINKLVRNNKPELKGTPSLPHLPPVPASKMRTASDFETELEQLTEKMQRPSPYRNILHAALNRVRPDNSPPILTPLSDDPEMVIISEERRPAWSGNNHAANLRNRAGKTLQHTLDSLAHYSKALDPVKNVLAQVNDKIASGRKRGRLPSYSVVALSIVAALGALSFLIGNLIDDEFLATDFNSTTKTSSSAANQTPDAESAQVITDINKKLIGDKKLEFAEDLTIDEIANSGSSSSRGKQSTIDRSSAGNKPPAATQPLATLSRSDTTKPKAISRAPAVAPTAAPANTPEAGNESNAAEPSAFDSPDVQEFVPQAAATAMASTTDYRYPLGAMLPFDLLPGNNIFKDDSIWSLAKPGLGPITRFTKTTIPTTFALNQPPALAEPISTFDNSTTASLEPELAAPALPLGIPLNPEPLTVDEALPDSTTMVPQTPVDKRELDILISKFLRFYETGNLDQYLRLFSENIVTESYRGINLLQQDYERFFNATAIRSLDFNAVSWRWDGPRAIGTGAIVATSQAPEMTSPVVMQGQIRIAVARNKDGISIEEFIQDFGQ